MKETLCAKMEEHIEAKLAEMETDSEKRAILQLFLYAQAITKIFFRSVKGQVKSVKELTENLKVILRQLKKDCY